MKRFGIVLIFVIAVLLLAAFLHSVFIGRTLLPQSFALGPLQVRYYGLFMAAALIAGYFLAQRRANRYGITSKELDSIIFSAVVTGFIGARLYHVVSDFNFYWHNPGLVAQVWRGGLSIYGAIIGGTAAVIWYAYRRTAATNRANRILNYLDWLAPSVLLGQIIGRFGNLFNYELLGYPTSLAWRMYVPLRLRPDGFLQFAYFHPLFLYEALANALILLVLLATVSKARAEKDSWISHPGSLFLSYIFLYNIVRFLLEFLRIDSVMAGGLRVNALVSLALAVGALAYLLVNFLRHGNQVPSNH